MENMVVVRMGKEGDKARWKERCVYLETEELSFLNIDE